MNEQLSKSNEPLNISPEIFQAAIDYNISVFENQGEKIKKVVKKQKILLSIFVIIVLISPIVSYYFNTILPFIITILGSIVAFLGDFKFLKKAYEDRKEDLVKMDNIILYFKGIPHAITLFGRNQQIARDLVAIFLRDIFLKALYNLTFEQIKAYINNLFIPLLGLQRTTITTTTTN